MRGKTDHYTIEDKGGDVMPFVVYAWSEHESGVLAGQERKQYLENFASEPEARAAYPSAWEGTGFRQVNVSLSHLPDENTPEAGGSYSDDY